MTTATFNTVESIAIRIAELDLLISNAQQCVESNEQLHNTLCRACCVLIASHLEGFLKDLTRGLLSDLNYNMKGFKNMPTPMKRAFCRKIAFYEGVEDREIEKRVRQLIDFFDNNSVKIDMDYFTYKENPNKNPKASFIDAMFERFGIKFVVNSIAVPAFEVVFGNDAGENFVLRREMKRFRSTLYHFPFTAIKKTYAFRRINKNEFVETLWHSFIEEIMTRRHSIVHGDVIGNQSTWEELASDVGKLHILMHGLAYSAADYLSFK